ncbi:unnamed protein product [Merluccius merluccius]
MGTGEYICVTLRGGAPWGFSVREGEGDTYTPFHVYQVQEGGAASQAGVRHGDEVVSLNGEPCGDLRLAEALYLINASTDCLQLLLKSPSSVDPDEEEEDEEEEVRRGETASLRVTLESTTLHILPSNRPPELPDGGSRCYGAEERDQEPEDAGEGSRQRRCFSPGAVVELRLTLPDAVAECTSLGSALGIEGLTTAREEDPCPSPEDAAATHTATHSLYVPHLPREPLGQHGVVLPCPAPFSSSPSLLGQVEFNLQHPREGGAAEEVGGPGVSGSIGSPGKEGDGEGGGGGGRHSVGEPASFSVSFGVPSEEVPAEEERDCDSEGDPDEPNKHRARHARLRRSESLSEKQVKEAKSKCKRIALLLSAAAPNPNNKGLLMFKKHRQRAKKYTLVSYGTGESEPESDDDDDDTVEFTLLATSDSDLDKQFFTDAQSGKGVLTINWDKGLLEIERCLNHPEEMECLPDTQGKGAMMFAQRRLRMDEITAEHEEMRRQGIPVEGLQESQTKAAYQQLEERSYMQSTTESNAYMDVAQHHRQDYQQQQIQQYSANMNGTVHHQTNEMQSSYVNHTAKPFSVENMSPNPYSPETSGTHQDPNGQGEEIASRDERIATPAIRTGVLQDTRKRITGKPMFTFKDAPKVSPNPALLNLLNRSDKKGLESGPEEDYLSLGAEACNFLQSTRVKHKTPPPVAPKPILSPTSLSWPQQIEQPQAPLNTWSPAQAQPQAPAPWAPQSQSQATHAHVLGPMANTRVAQQSPKPWQTPPNAGHHQASPSPPQQSNLYMAPPKSSSPINPMATVLIPSGSSYEMPAVRGKGADLFAKRQSRMEKFIVDSETVQANRESRTASPVASLPTEWKYSPNVRAPPPLAYNPIQSPSYPPAAVKQLPPSSPSAKAKAKKEKPKPTPKPLNVIDVMRHQPYQLNSSLFTYGPAQAPGGPYHQAYNPQYQQAPLLPPAYQPQSPQAPPPTHPYQPPSQAPYPPASNAPYQPAPYQPAEPPTPSTYTAPSTLMSGTDSASGGSSNAVAAAPKPRFMAKKSSAQALGRNYSLSPPASRVSSVGRPQTSASLSPRPQARVSTAPPAGKQSAWLERHLKPPTPWEAASRHPLGLVDEAFSHRDLHQAIVSNVHLAVQRKMLPEPPADWTARVSYQPSPAATPRSGSFQSQSWSYARSRSQSRPPMPSFVSPPPTTQSSVSLAPGRYYGSLPRQWQPQQRPAMDAHLMSSALSSEYRRPFAKPTFKAVYTSNTKWSSKR